MTLPRLEAINARWARVPPVSVSLAALAQKEGVGPQPRPATTAQTTGDRPHGQSTQALLDLLGGGGAGFATEKPAWLKAAEAT